MGIGVLGPLAVDDQGVRLSGRDRVVLSALALRAGETVDAAQLADALWGDLVPPSAPKVVQGIIVRLRKLLGRDAIETTPYGYRLRMQLSDVDSHRFEDLVGRAQQQLELGDPERAGYLLDTALALWRGRAFVDLEHWEPGRAAAVRLDELRRDAEEQRLDASLRAGHHREVLAQLRTLVAESPLRERRWALLALGQYRAGRQAEALRTLRDARRTLADEAGLDVGPELRDLEHAILRQEPSLLGAEASPTEPLTCPYLGLVPYDIGDAEGFFGRDADVARCLEQLAATDALVVVGPSGSGKSSLVRAGVCATLRERGLHLRVISPGTDPNAALGVGLAPRNEVVVVDQCEELLTMCPDEQTRTQFLDTIVDASASRQLIVVLRADRVGDLTGHDGFARLVERSLVLVGSPNEADLRAIIEGPARQAGLLLEPGLIDLLLREVDGEPGALPLVSHALRMTWERREGRTLTVAGYRATGGVRGAVARSAEQLYERLAERERPALRELLLRLVTAADDGTPTRSRLPRRLVVGDDGRDELIERLIAARLLISDDGFVEIAHEALTRAWPRLRDWLDDDVDGLRIRRHLAATADGWVSSKRPGSELYRGARLERALEWREQAGPELTSVEHAFLDASRELAESDRRRAEASAREQMRVSRRLRALLTGVAMLLVIAIVVGAIAFVQARRADEESERASRSAIEADARRVAAQALFTPDIDVATLLAVEGVRLDDSADTRASLLGVLGRSPALIRAFRAGSDPIATLDTSPDGSVIAVGMLHRGVTLYDTDTWRPRGTYDDVPPRFVTFHPGGGLLAVARDSEDLGDPEIHFDAEPLRLVDTRSAEAADLRLGGVPQGALWPGPPAFSGDGRFVAVSLEHAGRDRIVIWDLDEPAVPIRSIAPPGTVEAIALDSTGSRLYVTTFDPASTSTYDVATGEPVDVTGTGGSALALCPDGSSLGVADGDDVLMLDPDGLAVQQRLDGESPIVAIGCSHDSGTIAVASADQSISVWDASTGNRREELHGHASQVSALAFSADDALLYTAGIDSLVLTWDLKGDHRFVARTDVELPLAGHVGWMIASPDGELAALVNLMGSGMRFVDVVNGEVGPSIAASHRQWGAVAWRPGHRQLATTGGDGVVRVWDPDTGAMLTERRVADGHIGGLAFSADGSRLLIAERAGAITMLDAESLAVRHGPHEVPGHPVFAYLSPDGRTAGVFTFELRGFLVAFETGDAREIERVNLAANFGAFSPDGQRLAVTGRDGRVVLVDVATGALVTEPVRAHAIEAVAVSFAADGTRFVTSGRDGRVNLWDGSTGSLLGAVTPAGSDVDVAASFVADTNTVLIIASDGSVFHLDLTVESWTDHACTLAGRNLSADEWRRAFGERPRHDTCQL